MRQETIKKRAKEIKEFIEGTELKDVERYVLATYHNSLVNQVVK